MERKAWIISSFVGLTMITEPISLGWFVDLTNIIPVPIVCITVAIVFCISSQKILKNPYRK